MKISKKYLVILLTIVSTVILTSSIIYSESPISKKDIKKGFKEINSRIESDKNKNLALVTGDGIEITKERFQFYKMSVELLNSFQQGKAIVSVPSDTEIINELISTDLSVKYAKDIGIVATNDEVDAAIKNEREALSGTEPENEFVRELMKQRILSTGLTDDEFWNDTEIRYNYEKAIIIGKLATLLIENKEIKDYSEISNFQKELLTNQKDKLNINLSVIEAEQ